ncbi:hypothetical protein KCH_52520 [Kitasatospora cheerisanensis KCTC 2395]|uniref:Uncharacterized protein n=1 Tax=Kitasatospora cheerisanensis KCTC 2395 TaxID=1348663 RepID=A0A066YYF4_9ACTN|nr:hypothetical protein KCH_52520 [Kitasatospora cheerisanensis KCTC 2395]
MTRLVPARVEPRPGPGGPAAGPGRTRGVWIRPPAARLPCA